MTQPASVLPALPTIQRVRGTSDLLPPVDARLRGLEARLRDGFEAYGYQGIETPIIEPLELFLRKSGEEILARMYAFSHWNRRLCLRPELTASVMRAYANALEGRSLPLRLHYGGPTFRYERPSRGRQRQFTQVGVELIGAGSPAADAEVLHLACAGLEAAGLTTYRLMVGHMGVVLQMLRQLGMSEHAQGLLLDLMEPLARGRVQRDAAVARIVDVLGGGSPGAGGAHVVAGRSALDALPSTQATAVASDVLQRARLSVEGGARDPQRIIQRLLEKAHRPDPTEQVRAAVDFVLELVARAGDASRLEELRPLLQQLGLDASPLDEVRAALDLLDAYGARGEGARVSVDLSLARGLRYYTGLVFEIYADLPDGPVQLCGGGRYDDLIRAVGGREPQPACGFAYGLERVALTLGEQLDAPVLPRVLVVPVTPSDHRASLALAARLRAAGGLIVEQDVRQRGLKAALRHADRAGTDVVLILGEQEQVDGMVQVRAMRTRDERRVAAADVLQAIREVAA